MSFGVRLSCADCISWRACTMLLLAAQVERFLMYDGSLAGESGLLWSGAPMNFVPVSLRHCWNEPVALKNFVCGSSVASGTVSPGAVVPGPATGFSPAAALVVGGRTAPPSVTFQPGGSLMSSW